MAHLSSSIVLRSTKKQPGLSRILEASARGRRVSSLPYGGVDADDLQIVRVLLVPAQLAFLTTMSK